MRTVRRLTLPIVWVFAIAFVASHTGASAAESVPSDPASAAMPSSTDGVSPLEFAGSFVYDAPVDVARTPPSSRLASQRQGSMGSAL